MAGSLSLAEIRALGVPALALSIQQPWVDIVLGYSMYVKRWEFRTNWQYEIEGRRIALHASGRAASGHPRIAERFKVSSNYRDRLGAILGIATVHKQVLLPDDREGVNLLITICPGCSDSANLTALELENVVELEEPVDAKGSLGPWAIPGDVQAAIAEQLRAG